MRVCVVYDHVFPATVGGGERWLRDVAQRLAAAGHEVTYVTMRHWAEGEAPAFDGVTLVPVARAGRIYRDDRRRLGPLSAVRVRGCTPPPAPRTGVRRCPHGLVPVLPDACRRARAATGSYVLVVDWFEVWTRAYWRRYAGPVAGTVGWLVQRACIVVRHRANCISDASARRLVQEGYRSEPTVLPGLYAGPVEAAPAAEVDPDLVVYAGRHVREKRIDILITALARLRRERPGVHLRILGDGPTALVSRRSCAGLG